MARQRRMKGEGSITKLPSGKYRVRLEVDPSPLGKRKWLTALVKTQKEATEKLQEFVQTKKHEELVEKLKESFDDFIEPYISFKKSEGLLPSTLYRLKQTLKKASKDSLNHIPVQKITADLLQVVIDQWRAEGNKESTIRIKFKLINGYFEYLRQRKLIGKNPCKDVVFKKQKNKKHVRILTISQDEHEKLKKIMTEYWDNPKKNNTLKDNFLAVYLLTYETGMREGEIAGLKVKSVNLKESTVTVENNLTVINGELINNPPKTAAGYREIVISKKTLGYIKQLIEGADKDDYVFRNPSGRPFNPPSLLVRFREFQKEAGIDHSITFHTIRHTNASIMIAKGVPTPIVTERLGHSSVGVTYNTYAHALRDSEERKKALVEA